jgi:hypothetical protein
MNHEIHEAHEKRAETNHRIWWRLHPPGEPVGTAAPCYFVFLVYFVVSTVLPAIEKSGRRAGFSANSGSLHD